MKCWKCGREIPDSASECVYCSASMSRPAAVTAQGRAMRRIYDRFGSSAVFAKKSMMPVALGDLLEDSRKLRNQLDTVMSAGAGNLYLSQLQNAGKPDDAFRTRVKNLMMDQADLSEKAAAELMGYIDEMIGWDAGAAAQSRPAPVRPRPMPDGLPTILNIKAAYRAGALELSWGENLRSFTIDIAGKRLTGSGNAARIPMAPEETGCFMARVEGVCADGSTAVGRYFPRPCRINGTYSAGMLSLSWEKNLQRFTIDVNGEKRLTGSGNAVRFPLEPDPRGRATYVVLEGVDLDGLTVREFYEVDFRS